MALSVAAGDQRIAWTRPDAYDMLGLGLVAGFVVWTVVSAVVRDGNPWPQVAMLAVGTAAYVFGRVMGRRQPALIAVAIVLSILISTVASGPSAFSGGPLDPPLGYGNANGALFTLGAAAAALVAVLADRDIGTAFAAAMLVLTVISASRAAMVLAVAVLVVSLLARRLRRRIAVTAPLVVLTTVAVTAVLAFSPSTRASSVLEALLTERRTTLWHEALSILNHYPVFGVGPGMFAETSPTALADSDARWAHSAYLQTAAETGLVGVALLGLLLVWAYGALYRSTLDARVVVIGTAAVSAFAVHAAIDYIAHFPTVVAAAALIAGLTSSRPVPVSVDGSMAPVLAHGFDATPR